MRRDRQIQCGGRQQGRHDYQGTLRDCPASYCHVRCQSEGSGLKEVLISSDDEYLTNDGYIAAPRGTSMLAGFRIVSELYARTPNLTESGLRV
jgi:hypothetical protein